MRLTYYSAKDKQHKNAKQKTTKKQHVLCAAALFLRTTRKVGTRKTLANLNSAPSFPGRIFFPILVNHVTIFAQTEPIRVEFVPKCLRCYSRFNFAAFTTNATSHYVTWTFTRRTDDTVLIFRQRRREWVRFNVGTQSSHFGNDNSLGTTDKRFSFAFCTIFQCFRFTSTPRFVSQFV